MKTRILSLLLLLSGVTANAQFLSNLNNFSGGLVLESDGLTPMGTGYTVEVFAGSNASGPLLATGSSVGFGFFDAGQVDIGAPVADVFVRIFDTNPFGFAGSNQFIERVTTATGGDVNGVPPELPGTLAFTGATFFLPEPSSVALTILGVGLLALRRRAS